MFVQKAWILLGFVWRPEQEDGVGHRQLPARQVGVGRTVLRRLGVSNVGEQRDQAVHQDVELLEQHRTHNVLRGVMESSLP